MSRPSKTLLVCAVMLLLLLPWFSTFADSNWKINEGIVPACNTDLANGQFKDPCGFCTLIHLAGHIISFLLYAAVLIAAIAFTIAGFKYLTAAGNQSQIESAHKIFKNVALGLILALAAWLIVDTIINALTVDKDNDKVSDYSLLGKPCTFSS